MNQSSAQASLGKIESMLGDKEGPFFMGGDFTIVDCVYAPFLERWRFQVCIRSFAPSSATTTAYKTAAAISHGRFEDQLTKQGMQVTLVKTPQLPCMYDGLEPYDPSLRPNLYKWYQAMEARVPAYPCRIQGVSTRNLALLRVDVVLTA
jgi:glutathione S-transferase